MASDASRPKLDSLTSLRFFAAFAIVIHHIEGRWVEEGSYEPFVLDQAVSFFFVLSGFILTYVYPELPTRRAQLRFLQARIARVWPGHVAAFVLALLLLAEPGHVGAGFVRAGVALLNLALLQAWVPIQEVVFSYNSVSWSLSTELGFYLLFPLLIQRFHATWWWKLAVSLAIALGLARLASALGLGRDDAMGLVYVNPLARLFEFMLGMCTALAFERLRPRIRIGSAVATALEALTLAAMLVAARSAAGIAFGWKTRGWIDVPLVLWLFHGGLCGVSFASVVLVFAIGRGWLSRLLALRGLVLLGEISFTIYLLHQILLRCVDQWRAVFDPMPVWLQMTLYFGTLFVLSHWSWAAVERPLRARITAIGARGVATRSEPGPAARDVMARLFAPRGRALAAETLLAVAPFLALAVALQRPAPARPAVFGDEVPGVDAPVYDARFGATAVLRAVRIDSGDGALDVAFAWRSLRALPRETVVALHVLDEGGVVVARMNRLIGAGYEAGDTFVDRVHVAGIPADAVRLGVELHLPEVKKPLRIDRGSRDSAYRQLLLDLATPPHAADAVPTG